MLSGVSARSSSLKSLPFKTISRRSSSFLASSSSKNSSSFSLCSSSSCWNNNWDEQRRTTFTSSISKEVERIRSRAKASNISSSSGTTSRTEEKTPPPAQTKKDLVALDRAVLVATLWQTLTQREDLTSLTTVEPHLAVPTVRSAQSQASIESSKT